MLRLLRRSRLLALSLLLAVPALGGAWLQAMHPCPAEAPWIVEHGEGHGDHGGHQGGDTCHCVSACAGAALAVLESSHEIPLAVIPAAQGRPRLDRVAAPPALRPSDRLPPATAPPLA